MNEESIIKSKNIDEPVIIHVVTQKGKGYEFAEKNPDKYHGVSPFNLESGEPKSRAKWIILKLLVMN